MIMLNKKNSLSLSLSQPSHDNTLDIDTIYRVCYINSLGEPCMAHLNFLREPFGSPCNFYLNLMVILMPI